MQKTGKTWSAYLLSFVGLGLVNASLGPSLPHLARHTGTTIAVISYIFVAYRGGYLIGSFFGGRLFDRLPGNLFMAGLLLLLAVAVAIVPTIGVLWLLLGVLVVAGIMGGAVDVGGNVLLLWLAPPRLGSLMSILHLAFGVGAFLSPLFLSQALRWTGDVNAGYWALIVLVIAPALWLMGVPSPHRQKTQDSRATASAERPLVILIALFFLLYVGAEAAFGGWIYTFAIKREIADEIQAGTLTSAYWGFYSAGRLLSALAALKVKPGRQLRISVAGALAALVLVVMIPGSTVVVWTATILFGLFMGPIFPVAVIYANTAMRISGKMTGVFFVGASLGAMIVPWLIGQLFEAWGPMAVMGTILTAMVGAGSILVVIRRLVRTT